MIKITHGRANEKAFKSVRSIAGSTRRGMRQAFFQYGNDLKKTASRQILAKPKHGRIYRIRRGKRIIRHRASAPGESPANLSGNYRKSIGFKIRGSSQMVFGAGSATVPYAVWLERGTRKMEPRPGLGNAIKATERNGVKYFETAIQRNLKT